MQRITAFLFLLFSLIFSQPAYTGFLDKPSPFLKAEEAFVLTFSQKDQQLHLHWDIAEGYWLYQHAIRIQAKDAQLGTWHFPPATAHDDPYLGQTQVFYRQLDLSIPLNHVGKDGEITLYYQGCTDGLCYPPSRQQFFLSPLNSPSQSESTRLAQHLSQHHYAFLGFFLLGLGLAFTPCVLPMLPLLSALVIGKKDRANTLQALGLSFSYVQGMALTYSLLGLGVVSLGLPFQMALQRPVVLIGLAILFTLLACSMFGLFTLRLPSRLQNTLVALSQKQKSGAFGGVFIMGAISGLIASPCTTAPLSGALLYVAQTGDLLTGGLSLYLLALGMGLPLMLLTVFGNNILPKSGAWLQRVKTAFGFVMLALPILLLSRIIGEIWTMCLWAVLACSFCLWLAFSLPAHKVTGWGGKCLALLLAILCLLFPLKENVDKSTLLTPSTAIKTTIKWQTIHHLSELQHALTTTQKPLTILDIYADWCVACKDLEKYTFSNPQVQTQLQHAQLLRLDVSQNKAENQQLLQHLSILGLPAVLFFNAQGQEISSQRLAGFVNADDFHRTLKRLIQEQETTHP